MNSEENDSNLLKLQANIKNSTQSYVLFSVLTVINTVITLFGFGLSFSFSAFIPGLQSELAVLFRDEVKQQGISNVFLVSSLIICFIYLASSLISLKKPKFLIFGLVITTLDSVVMTVFIVNNFDTIFTSLLAYSLYVIFHVWIMYYLINGVVSLKRIKSLREI